MHGYGYPPQRPPTRRSSPGTLIGLRVLFVALTFLSCGFLSWAAMLRLALVTRRALDRVLVAVSVVLNVAVLVYIGSTPDGPEAELTPVQTIVFMAWMACSVLGTTIYYLYAEIRHYAQGPQGAGPPSYVDPLARTVTSGPRQGYPPAPWPVPPHTAGPAPAPPPASVPTPRSAPAPVPPPVTPHPATSPRLDQVQAELDELSDYLRKEGGNP
ncbi:hypothetical protein OG909_11620 [Streptomyces sp. NBC_01754]|uniref:hypothetical protein n=1 Tax=Streptomyces sp. NBC_01754 TaxID=2975930 RepID=UPI002DDA4D41|nr:hypothetical protein [Streptomyces sp. NBC_01754]WSC92888.1 hypothetical protein OG909_11620 [Streptomyces sp. NBC_01754]